eukprot:531097_1
MCTNQDSIKWIELSSCPAGHLSVPSGIDRNNYLVFDRDFWYTEINCIFHKYDFDNDKWIKINVFNNIENMSPFSAALDVKKQILLLFRKTSL